MPKWLSNYSGAFPTRRLNFVKLFRQLVERSVS